MRHRQLLLCLLLASLLSACGDSGSPPVGTSSTPSPRPAILLVTLDTTRADHLGFESGSGATPALDALAARGLRFSRAIAPAPQTLPSHASMMTGLYPAGHGIHENGRFLGTEHAVLAEVLAAEGFATAAFVSGFPLARQFGLARGFEVYDDDFGAGSPSSSGAVERRADSTAERALVWLSRQRGGIFLWVHFYDPHEPYEPPEPFASRFSEDPYLGEIAFMDQQVGRLVAAFEERFGEAARVLVVADHGEGLGDHGEVFHGNLLYQEVMRVPLILAGPGIEPGVVSEPVGIRRVFDTVLAWAGACPAPCATPPQGLQAAAQALPDPVVLAEAMKPFLQYGWQPQVLAVAGELAVIEAGEREVYDLTTDPGESDDLAGRREVPREVLRALRDYPLPSLAGGEAAAPLRPEDRQKLASLGYAGGGGERPPVREDAPSPREMKHLFAALDAGSGLFVRERYREAIPLFETVLAEDPANLMVALRLAVAHSVLGHEERAADYFERAGKIAPDSLDLQHYRALHLLRRGRWQEAAPLLETVVARMPQRLPALEALAEVREQQGRLEEAADLLRRAVALQDASPAQAADLVKLGHLNMAQGETVAAIEDFERARQVAPEAFDADLELGVCYLAARRLPEARDSLDRVPKDHPGHAMALFKRAQVSVLLREADSPERIRTAWQEGDETTRALIRNEALFEGVALP